MSGWWSTAGYVEWVIVSFSRVDPSQLTDARLWALHPVQVLDSVHVSTNGRNIGVKFAIEGFDPLCKLPCFIMKKKKEYMSPYPWVGSVRASTLKL
jgi:hypothetical protein